MGDCPIADALVNSALHKLQRRKNDPVTTAIHMRLDALEELSNDMKEIKEWIATVVKVTRALEIIGGFITKWTLGMAKVSIACGVVWASIKLGGHEFVELLKAIFRGGK